VIILDRRVRNVNSLDDMQFEFRPGSGTTDAIVGQILEKFIEQKKDLWMAFVDLEKAFYRVPRDMLWLT